MKTRKPKSKPKPAPVHAWEVPGWHYQYYEVGKESKLQYGDGHTLAALCRRGHPVVVQLRVPAGAVADLVYANGRVLWYIRPSGKPDHSAA